MKTMERTMISQVPLTTPFYNYFTVEDKLFTVELAEVDHVFKMFKYSSGDVIQAGPPEEMLSPASVLVNGEAVEYDLLRLINVPYPQSNKVTDQFHTLTRLSFFAWASDKFYGRFKIHHGSYTEYPLAIKEVSMDLSVGKFLVTDVDNNEFVIDLTDLPSAFIPNVREAMDFIKRCSVAVRHKRGKRYPIFHDGKRTYCTRQLNSHLKKNYCGS